jgi:hypothetical protein
MQAKGSAPLIATQSKQDSPLLFPLYSPPDVATISRPGYFEQWTLVTIVI